MSDTQQGIKTNKNKINEIKNIAIKLISKLKASK
jgi:hypothetical protein